MVIVCIAYILLDITILLYLPWWPTTVYMSLSL